MVNESIEKMIEGLSGDGKTMALFHFVKSGQTADPDYVDVAVGYCAANVQLSNTYELGIRLAEQMHWTERADSLHRLRLDYLRDSKNGSACYGEELGDLCLRFGMRDDAIEAFRTSYLYNHAEAAAKKLKDQVFLADLYKPAFESYEKNGDFRQAALLALEIGDIDHAKKYNLLQPPAPFPVEKVTGIGALLSGMCMSLNLVAYALPVGLIGSIISNSDAPPLKEMLAGVGALYAACSAALAGHYKSKSYNSYVDKMQDPWYRFLDEHKHTELYENEVPAKTL